MLGLAAGTLHVGSTSARVGTVTRDYVSRRRRVNADQSSCQLSGWRSLRALSRQQECLDQIALAAPDHPGEALEPRASRDFGFPVEPFSEQFELTCLDASFLDSIEEMREECGRNVFAADLWHKLDSVEPAGQSFSQTGSISGL